MIAALVRWGPWPAMTPVLELTLPPAPASAKAARRAVVGVLADRDRGLLDTAELLADELVANAVHHAATTLDFRVEAGGTAVRLSVRDRNPILPVPSCPDPHDVSGRGLLLVDALASAWGAEPTEAGKVVWCVVVSAG